MTETATEAVVLGVLYIHLCVCTCMYTCCTYTESLELNISFLQPLSTLLFEAESLTGPRKHYSMRLTDNSTPTVTMVTDQNPMPTFGWVLGTQT